jgi:hypothetical protein
MTEKFTHGQMAQLREFLRWFCQEVLAPSNQEFVVQSTVLNMLKMTYADRAPEKPLGPIIDAALAAVRANPEGQAQIHAQFQQFQERLIGSFSERIPDSESADLKWLRDWKPTKWVN